MNHLKSLFIAAVTLLSLNGFAQQSVIYVNGIQNTADDAWATANAIQSVLDSSQNHRNNIKSFSVTAVWNPIGFYGKSSGQWDLSQDQQELFVLKSSEESFKSDLEGLQCDINAPVCSVDPGSAVRLTRYADALSNIFTINPKPTLLNQNPSPVRIDMNATGKAIRSLVEAIKDTKSSIIVAHSQGNLLANLAFARLAFEFGNNAHNMAKIFNVANTSSISLHNINFTHASDAAIFTAATATGLGDKSLETYPVRQGYLRETSLCTDICNFGMGSSTFQAITENINYPNNIDGSVDNTLNHSISLTYLNPTYNIYPTTSYSSKINFTPNATRFVDRFEDLVYVAAAKLPPPVSSVSTFVSALETSPTTFGGIAKVGNDVYVASLTQDRTATRKNLDGSTFYKSSIILTKIASNAIQWQKTIATDRYMWDSTSLSQMAIIPSTDGSTIRIADNSYSGSGYDMMSSVYSINLATQAVSTSMLVAAANSGWYPYFSSTGQVNHFSYAGYLRCVNITCSGSVQPNVFQTESENRALTLVGLTGNLTAPSSAIRNTLINRLKSWVGL